MISVNNIWPIRPFFDSEPSRSNFWWKSENHNSVNFNQSYSTSIYTLNKVPTPFLQNAKKEFKTKWAKSDDVYQVVTLVRNLFFGFIFGFERSTVQQETGWNKRHDAHPLLPSNERTLGPCSNQVRVGKNVVWWKEPFEQFYRLELPIGAITMLGKGEVKSGTATPRSSYAERRSRLSASCSHASDVPRCRSSGDMKAQDCS